MLKVRPYSLFLAASRWVSIKEQLKDYKFPELKREDCEQKYISGWGPGGQKVNTAQNAVELKHIPTGIVIKDCSCTLRSGPKTDIYYPTLFHLALSIAEERQKDPEQKVHQSRLLPKNIEIAFERMKYALDRHINRDECYEEQFKRLQRKKEMKAKKKRESQRKRRKEAEEVKMESATE